MTYKLRTACQIVLALDQAFTGETHGQAILDAINVIHKELLPEGAPPAAPKVKDKPLEDWIACFS